MHDNSWERNIKNNFSRNRRLLKSEEEQEEERPEASKNRRRFEMGVPIRKWLHLTWIRASLRQRQPLPVQSLGNEDILPRQYLPQSSEQHFRAY